MKTILVKICPDGITAKEANRYENELDKELALGHTPSFNLLEAYRAEEVTLRTFKIDMTSLENKKKELPEWMQKTVSGFGYTPNIILEAEIFPNGKIRIL